MPAARGSSAIWRCMGSTGGRFGAALPRLARAGTSLIGACPRSSDRIWEVRHLARRKVGEVRQDHGDFRPCGERLSQGRPAQLWVAETDVVLAQPARTIADERSGQAVVRRTTGPRLQLALADRKLFQTAEISQSAVGTLAARNRRGDLPPRRFVATMACITVWHLQSDPSPAATGLDRSI